MARKPSIQATQVASAVAQKFAAKSILNRYVDDAQRLRDNRPALDVFRANPGEDHLSVNLVGAETHMEIAAYYRKRFQGDKGQVAVCDHTVVDYNGAAKLAGVAVLYNRSDDGWEFAEGHGKSSPAYRSRPVRGSLPSPSHAGVEYVRIFDELAAAKFARRMCNRRFHLR